MMIEDFKRYRKRKGFSQGQLVELTGLSRSTLSKIERDIFNPSVAVVEKIALAMGVPPTEVFEVIRAFSHASQSVADRTV